MRRFNVLFILTCLFTYQNNAVVQSITKFKTPRNEIILLGNLHVDASKELLDRDVKFSKEIIQNWASTSTKIGLFLQPNILKTVNAFIANPLAHKVTLQVHDIVDQDLKNSLSTSNVERIAQHHIPVKTFLIMSMAEYIHENCQEVLKTTQQKATVTTLRPVFDDLRELFATIHYDSFLEEFTTHADYILNARHEHEIGSPEYLIFDHHYTTLQEALTTFTNELMPCPPPEISILSIIELAVARFSKQGNITSNIEQLASKAKKLFCLLNAYLIQRNLITSYSLYKKIIIMTDQAYAQEIMGSLHEYFNARITYAAGITEVSHTPTSPFNAHQLSFTLKHIVPIKCANPYCSPCQANKKLLACSQCTLAAYCSKECQRMHWPEHKLLCKKLTLSPQQ